MKNILKALSFPSKVVKWIMACLWSAHYFLLLNGRVQGEFEGKKGLRQGDPMSPLLFVIAMEYFTRILQWYSAHTGLRHHPRCKRIGLNALCFAEDLILLCKANNRSISLLLEAFQ